MSFKRRPRPSLPPDADSFVDGAAYQTADPKPKPKKKVAVTFRVPPELLERARDITAATGLVLNDLGTRGLENAVNQAYADYEERYGHPVPQRKPLP